MRTGFDRARGRFIVVQDADLELDPGDLVRLLARAAAAGRPLAVFGSRFMGSNRRFYGLPTFWANRMLTLLCNVLNGIWLTDMNTCYKLMPAEVARALDLTSRGFDMEPEITTKLARLGVSIVEVPINYLPRTRSEGKKIRARDVVRYIRAMLRYRFSAQPAGRPRSVAVQSDEQAATRLP